MQDSGLLELFAHGLEAVLFVEAYGAALREKEGLFEAELRGRGEKRLEDGSTDALAAPALQDSHAAQTRPVFFGMHPAHTDYFAVDFRHDVETVLVEPVPLERDGDGLFLDVDFFSDGAEGHLGLCPGAHMERQLQG